MSDQLGTITVICGPMSSGKSEELIRISNRYQFAGQQAIAFKPSFDSRDGDKIRSRNGTVADIPTFVVESSFDIFEHYHEGITAILIDEAQFFDDKIVEVAQRLVDMGVDVIISGLDKNWQASPFGPMPQLLAIADDVVKLKAVCMHCKRFNATYTYRKTRSKEERMVGGDESYEARCLSCWREY